MKKLYLIGNGFDLAHGIRTGYNDLLDWYKKRVMTNVRQRDWHKDVFLHAKLYSNRNLRGHSVRHNCPSDFNALIASQDLVKVKSEFFNDLLSSHRERNWVDIESFYFESLKQIAEIPKSKISASDRLQKVENLNKQFQGIQDLLVKYLQTLKRNVEPIPAFLKLFDANTHQKLFLNFNYTNTLDSYVERFINSKKVTQVANIHGQLGEKENPIIFGYGDQHDEIYTILENFNEFEYIKFIKYPKYPLSDGFQKLTQFINKSYEKFTVDIIGHSCGLSDRTLLREILENKNCHSVSIHYYPDKNDFERKSSALTRHFQDKIVFLKNIQPFNTRLRCPQAK